jgi:hypothetical protein
MIGWYMNNDLEGSGHDLILKYYPGIRLEALRKLWKTSDRIANVRAKIWTWD